MYQNVQFNLLSQRKGIELHGSVMTKQLKRIQTQQNVTGATSNVKQDANASLQN